MNWSGLETVFAFAIVLGLAVFMHEMGHFLAAKALGVRVLEFAFGFPPKLVTLFERNGTQYNICALPIGGYVKLAGMEPGEEAGPDGFNSKPPWMRMIVYFAGPFMNFVLAAIIFIGMGATVGVPQKGEEVRIVGVRAGEPAQRAGFQEGDRVIAIDGQPIAEIDDMLKVVQHSANKALTFTVARDGARTDLHVVPAVNDSGVGQIGVELTDVSYVRKGVLGAVTYGTVATWRWTHDTARGIVRIFYDPQARKDVGGPVAIALIAGKAFREGAITFFTFLAAISVNLGVLNLLPLFVVDGGHIALLMLETVRGRRLPQSLQVSIQVVGMALILLMVALLTVRDIANWAGGKF